MIVQQKCPGECHRDYYWTRWRFIKHWPFVITFRVCMFCLTPFTTPSPARSRRKS